MFCCAGCNPFKCFSSGSARSADQMAASRSAGLAALLSSDTIPQHPQASSQPRGTISNSSQQQNEYRQVRLVLLCCSWGQARGLACCRVSALGITAARSECKSQGSSGPT